MKPAEIIIIIAMLAAIAAAADADAILLPVCLYSVDEVRKLIVDGARVNCADAGGDTPLHNAIHCAAREAVFESTDTVTIIDVLIAAGADVNAQNQFGSTPLHLAAMFGANKIVAALLRAGADRTLLRDGVTPSERARWKGHATTAELIDRFDAKKTPPQACGYTHENADYGDIAVGTRVRLGKHREVKGSVNWAMSMDEFVGKIGVVQSLGLDSGGCPTVRVDTDEEAWAWRVRDLEYVAEAAPPSSPEPGSTPNGTPADPAHKAPPPPPSSPGQLDRDLLSACLIFANADRVRELIAAGASVNCADSDGDTPLHNAVYRTFDPGVAAAIVDVLIAAGADVNARSASGRTPLHIAAQRGLDRAVTALLRAGADTSKLLNGRTAAMLAREMEHTATAELIGQFVAQTKKPYEWTHWNVARDFAILPLWEWLRGVVLMAVPVPKWLRDSRAGQSLVTAAAVLVTAALCWMFLWTVEKVAQLLRIFASATMWLAVGTAFVAAMFTTDEYAKRYY